MEPSIDFTLSESIAIWKFVEENRTHMNWDVVCVVVDGLRIDIVKIRVRDVEPEKEMKCDERCCAYEDEEGTSSRDVR